MRILIDADGCPVTNIAVSISKSHGLECIIVCDSSHIFSSDYAQVITVDKGADSADMKLVNIALKGDMLLSRHTAKKIRRSGGRLKGPPKRTKQQDEDFRVALTKLIEDNINFM